MNLYLDWKSTHILLSGPGMGPRGMVRMPGFPGGAGGPPTSAPSGPPGYPAGAGHPPFPGVPTTTSASTPAAPPTSTAGSTETGDKAEDHLDDLLGL